jgi:hypothetical protein
MGATFDSSSIVGTYHHAVVRIFGRKFPKRITISTKIGRNTVSRGAPTARKVVVVLGLGRRLRRLIVCTMGGNWYQNFRV